jgi:asparagine synthase (glutamine-hydrolysing)
MCGIIGEVRFDGNVRRQSFTRMVGELAARGPDASGIQYLSNDRLALGHQRLSVIDLTDSAAQPMANEDETVWLVFNGEIYNYRGLRRQLLRDGHTFKSQSDSEAILHAYEQWGEDCVSRLRGMFAFAIWDDRRGQLFLARDHLGIKPLYYWRTNTCFVFASQPRAILQHPDFSRSIDQAALSSYLAYRYVPGELAIFEGMRKLPAGSQLTVAKDRFESRRFWKVSYNPKTMHLEDALVDIEQQLRRSIEDQLVSDVPVGIWLSGGIDSSTIAAVATNKVGDLPCFTIGFDDAYSDERKFARNAADWLGCQIHEEVITATDAVKLLPEIIDAYDEPFFDHSAIPTYAVSKLSRKHGIKVALSGDGGDELFAGYLWYDAFFDGRGRVRKLLDYLNPNSRSTKAILKNLFRLTGFMDGQSQDRLLCRSQKFDHLALLEKHYNPNVPLITALQMIDVNTFLVDDVLTKVDRASMACGVEVRVPFLDVDLVETAFSVSHDLVYGGKERKFLLKHAVSNLLGPDILTARKKGFSVPLAVWMRRGLDKLVHVFVPDGILVNAGILEQRNVQAILEQGDTKLYWLLFSLEMWARRWIADDMPEPSYLLDVFSRGRAVRAA